MTSTREFSLRSWLSEKGTPNYTPEFAARRSPTAACAVPRDGREETVRADETIVAVPQAWNTELA